MKGADNQTFCLNATCHNSTDPPQGIEPQISPVHEIMRITSIVCYVAILLMSSLGNSTIIAIVLRNKSMQSKANVLIINMAVSDLLASVFALPRMLDVEISGSLKWKVPNVIAEGACKLGPFMREVSCAVSIFSMVAIALDRFFAIVIPLTRKPRLFELKYLISTIWLTALATNALYLYAFRVKFNQIRGLIVCSNHLTEKKEKIFDMFRFVVFIAVPLLVLVTLYIAIAFNMRQQAIPGATVQSFATNRRQQNKKVVKLAIAIVASFFVSWTPYYILLLLVDYKAVKYTSFSRMEILFVVQTIFTILTYASFAINPVICITCSSNFRRHIRRTFCRSHSPKTLTFTRGTTATTANQTTIRHLSSSNISLDISLRQVKGIENQAQKHDES